MTSDGPATALRPAAVRVSGLPGLRTLRSPRFRVLLAATLLLTATTLLGFVLIRQASDPAGQYAIDLAAYLAAAARLASGASPYSADLLAGPIAAQQAGNYLYPPLLAQLLSPLSGLPLGVVSIGWLAAQVAAVYASLLVALRLGRPQRTRSVEPLLWAGVAIVWFLPVFDTLWKGNVSGFLALQVALVAAGGAVAGAALAAGVLLKVAPIGLGPLALVGGRRVLSAAMVTGVIALAASMLVSPSAWIDYLRVLPNLFAGDATQPNNLSPWAMSLTLGASSEFAAALRHASLVLAAACALAAFLIGRRPGGLAAGVVFGTAAMLLLPAQLWYHYLAVLLPLAALAWGCAGDRLRVSLLASAAAISLGTVWLPLATVGAVLLIVCLLVALWPDPVRRVQHAAPPPGAPQETQSR